MNIENHEPAMPTLDTLQKGQQYFVIIVMGPKRPLGVIRWKPVFPDLQSPGLFGREVDRSVATPVDVDFKTGSMENDPVRNVAGDEPRKWVLLAKALIG
ncbi:hypothetical protein RHSP_61396 [Rhizobium freirei PRF 81]|uniref:Uncharacterized protein n=1 Tax=Rhizobium freirei PRF 81 TaxID=363754 RepID=N6UDM0_9HYPH|nr:hypothetical protein RHSP_61396 [Rhizobium freirei PRF 81]